MDAEKQPDIISTLTEMENCIHLLLPRPEDFFIEDEALNVTSVAENASKPLEYADETKIHKSRECSGSSDSDEDENSSSTEPIFDFRKYGILNPHFSLTLKVDPGVI